MRSKGMGTSADPPDGVGMYVKQMSVPGAAGGLPGAEGVAGALLAGAAPTLACVCCDEGEAGAASASGADAARQSPIRTSTTVGTILAIITGLKEPAHDRVHRTGKD